MNNLDILKKRILLIGANGMLGERAALFLGNKTNTELLCASMEDRCFNQEYGYVQFDLAHRESVWKLVTDFYPDVIINAAAFTNVDLCETERELAWKVNVKGVEYLSEMARTLDIHLIHLSSDYVFDGKNGPYFESSTPNPISYYGRTKLAAENALRISGANYTIIRPNVLYGPAKHSRPDFVKWVVTSLRSEKTISIVTDQFNNPTYIDDLIDAIARIIQYKKNGIYHIGGREVLSRFDFTMRIAKFFQLDKSFIKPITTAELHQAAARPLKSGLIILKAQTELGYNPLSIEDSLFEMQKELQI